MVYYARFLLLIDDFMGTWKTVLSLIVGSIRKSWWFLSKDNMSSNFGIYTALSEWVCSWIPRHIWMCMIFSSFQIWNYFPLIKRYVHCTYNFRDPTLRKVPSTVDWCFALHIHRENHSVTHSVCWSNFHVQVDVHIAWLSPWTPTNTTMGAATSLVCSKVTPSVGKFHLCNCTITCIQILINWINIFILILIV